MHYDLSNSQNKETSLTLTLEMEKQKLKHPTRLVKKCKAKLQSSADRPEDAEEEVMTLKKGLVD